MKKEIIRGSISLGVLLVLYILAAFLIPFVHTAVFWVSFVFTLIAFGVAAASIYIAFVKNPDAKSKFYGFPIARIGVIYGASQLIAGFVCMALGAWIPVWAAVLVYAIALGLAYLLAFLQVQSRRRELRTMRSVGADRKTAYGSLFL